MIRIPSPRGGRPAALALAGAVLSAGLVACGTETDSDGSDDATGGNESDGPTSEAGAAAASAAADWITGELTDGVLVNEEFGTPDPGTTVDAIYALRAIDGDEATITAMTDAVTAAGKGYVTTDGVWAGNAGKLVSLAVDSGGDPTDVAGFDALKTLERRTDDNGRTSDKSEFGDFANSLGQAWAVRGLYGAGSAEAEAATGFLLQQQCEDGYFRQDFSAPDADDQTCDGSGGEPSIDATALAVVVLTDIAGEHPDLGGALDKAVEFLAGQQGDDGSFVGSSELPANANSTGLAGWALQLGGEDEAAAGAAAWVRGQQVPECEGDLAAETGAIAYDGAALAAAGGEGITEKSSYQWRLATAQAIPSLLATPEDAAPAECPAG